MAYDEILADRMRQVLADQDGLSEKSMFGGRAFLIHGHMAAAASGQGAILLRVNPAEADRLVDGVSVTRMVMRGREMNGWLRVSVDRVDTEDDLHEWLNHGVAFVRSLPPK